MPFPGRNLHQSAPADVRHRNFCGPRLQLPGQPGGQGRPALLRRLPDRAGRGIPWLARFRRPDQPALAGGYAGWASPTHILAARENLQWGAPDLRNKTRAFQNCCGGAGTHGFFIAWKNAARFDHGPPSVNLHIDKLLPQAEIRGFQPYKGLLAIQLKQDGKVRVRTPEFVLAKEVTVRSGTNAIQPRIWGNYLELGDRKAGEEIELAYLLPLREEEATLGVSRSCLTARSGDVR